MSNNTYRPIAKAKKPKNNIMSTAIIFMLLTLFVSMVAHNGSVSSLQVSAINPGY